MAQQINLKELERNAFRSNYQDGLMDILLGLLLLLMSFGPTLGGDDGLSPITILALMFAYAALVLGGFWAIKKYIVTPRLGIANFGPARQRKRKKMSFILSMSILAGVILLLIFVTLYQVGIPTNLSGPILLYGLAAVFGIGAIVGFSLMAYQMDYSRGYLYGWFYALGVLSTFWLLEQGVKLPIGSVLLSGIMVANGLLLFIRFMRQHPLPPTEISIQGE